MKFEEIYHTYWQKIFRLCMGYTNDAAIAKDLAQDTFIAVWQHLSSFKGESSIGTWIYRIASNNCLKFVERQKRITQTDFPSDLMAEKAVNIEPQIQFLYQCIAQLPETDRIIISLELDEVKQAEIATIVGLSEANVRVRIHRIKEKLTQRFKENGY